MKEPAERRPTIAPEHPLFAIGYAPPVVERKARRVASGVMRETTATIAQETPVTVAFNSVPHAVMMATPADIEDFARGFTVTEGIATDPEIIAIDVVRQSSGITANVRVPLERAAAIEGRGRALVGRTGCGICGITTFDDLRHVAVAPPATAVSIRALCAAAAALASHQPYFAATRAVHAAAFADVDGRILIVREDVGRHNALDKVIGAAIGARIDVASGFAIVTSRASYELVAKCAAVGIAVLAAVSRPTDLAIRTAEATGIGLAALVRGDDATLYANIPYFRP